MVLLSLAFPMLRQATGCKTTMQGFKQGLAHLNTPANRLAATVAATYTMGQVA